MSERRGLMVLVILCLISAGFNQYVPRRVSAKQIDNFEREHQQVLSDLRDNKKNSEGPIDPNPDKKSASSEKIDPFSAKPAPARSAKVTESSQAPPADPELRINTASAADLIRSGLLERVMAYRIIKYRESLGGFVSTAQLAEVYEMSDSLYSNILDAVILEGVEVRTIAVNRASAEEMMEHPYIHKGLARQIVNYREKVNPFGSASDLLKLYFMDEVLLEKLRPYLVF